MRTSSQFQKNELVMLKKKKMAESPGSIGPVSIACVQGSTNGIPISFNVLPMVPLVIPLVPMVMPMVLLALLIVPLESQWYNNGTIGYGTIGKITNGTIGRTPNRASLISTGYCRIPRIP